MSWIVVAIAAYFLGAWVSILDKFILEKTVFRPALYAGAVGLLGSYAFLLIPFGFDAAVFQNLSLVAWGLVSGASFVIGLFFFYTAIRLDEVSRAAPIVGAGASIFALILSGWLLSEQLDNVQLFAFFILLAGGALISLRLGDLKLFSGKLILAAVTGAFFFAFSFVSLKLVFAGTNFLTGYILGRFGEVLAGLAFLPFIFPALKLAKQRLAAGLFLFNKALAAGAFFLQNYAIFLGSVSLVQAMSGLQYAFILLFASLLSWKFPVLLREKLAWKSIAVKTGAIILIGGGLSVLAFSQRPADLTPGLKEFGVTFSKPWAEELGLDWQKTFLAVLDDLGVKKIRLPAYWTEIEKVSGEYDWFNLDWQIAEAERRNAKIILIVGQRLPRWPECHIPEWAESLSKEEQENKLLTVIQAVVNRYKNSPVVEYWQVENEPFLPKFGICPEFDKKFLDEEIALVKSLDSRLIIVSASGELDLWLPAAKRSDILGTTMYRVIHTEKFRLGYVSYPLPPSFFHLKANLAKYLAGAEDIIVTELQAEPWGPKAIYEISPEERNKSLSIDQFKNNMEYAREVGFREAYLWGAEWWYWEKLHGREEFWNFAQTLFWPI